MTLKEIVKLMNMAQLDVSSKTIKDLWGTEAINMFDQENDPILKKYGDCEVESITNVCKLGITIWIK